MNQLIEQLIKQIRISNVLQLIQRWRHACKIPHLKIIYLREPANACFFPLLGGDLELVSEILLNCCSKIEDLHFCFAQDFASFYPYYLCEHVKPRTKVFIDTLGKFQLKPIFLPALPFHCNIQCNSNSRETDIWQVKYFLSLKYIFYTNFLMFVKEEKIYYLPWFIVWIQPRTEWAWLAAGLLQVFHSPQNCQDSWIRSRYIFGSQSLYTLIIKGYGLAWYSHFTIEMNKPATWQVKTQ